ncbi:MAG: kelch repeat-containing protein [Allosphingosinicella sp.]|uniref:Kelch repeat-containing protein n=1 Tax=Allosphingosinicella sp. TaxID=2823234 RepID=UPI003953B909
MRIGRTGALAGAAALALGIGVAAAAQQQSQPAAPAPQPGAPPAVGMGIGLEDGPDGPRIALVAPGGTAAAMGLQVGDVLLAVGGRPLTEPSVLTAYLQSLRVGDPVMVRIRRDGREIELTGRALPPAPGQGAAPSAPNRSTPVEAGELRETWNDRVSQGPPVGAMREFDGWSMGATMPLPRSEHAVAEFDGKIWVLGGYPPGRLPSNLVQVYDPATSRWSLGPALPEPIHHTHVAAVGGRIYVLGGEVEGASTGRPERFVSDVWMHDPAVGGWVPRAPMPTARGGGGKAVLDGKIYVAGGRPPGGSAFEVYDPATDSWEKLPDLPTQRNHLAMVALGGRIIVAGGRTGPGATAERVDVVEIYDPATRRWTRGAPLPAPRGGITGAALGGCMFVFGGEGEPNHVLNLTPHTYAYDPRADRWTQLADLPIAVHGLKGSAVIGGRIFLPGGGITLGGNSGTNAMQVYRPAMRCE